MSPLTNIQPKTLITSITFIILFTLVFFLKIPLTSNPFLNYVTSPTTTVHIPRQKPVFIAPSPSRPIRVDNGSNSSCDLFDGNWVYDESYPVYSPGSCPFVEGPFNCFKNNRPNNAYVKYRWQPYGCHLPRFDGKKMKKMLKGKKVVFIGDSLNRNMCESLLCSLGMSNLSQRTYLASNEKSFEIKNDDSTITMITATFLVQEQWEKISGSANDRETIKIDAIHENVSKYSDADFLIFNTGHWWNYNKVRNGEFFFREGDVLHEKMDIGEAYTKAIHTWANWVDNNINKTKTQVFFMAYTSDHFDKSRSCDREVEPTKDERLLKPHPWLMTTLEEVISKMSTPIVYLNITKLTGYRKDGHPSMYGWHSSSTTGQDCVHWCLPGVPDSWNQLLYASMLSSSTSTN